MKSTKLLGLSLILFCNLYAQDIRGKIINNDNVPIAGVSVSLTSPPQSTTTDSNGAFYFGNTPISQKNITNYGSWQMRSGLLAIHTSHSKNITLDLYNIKGTRIRTIVHNTFIPGYHSFQVFTHQDPYGIFFIAGKVGSISIRLMAVNTGSPIKSARPHTPASLMAKISADSYELLCTKTGYNELRVSAKASERDLGELVMMKTGDEKEPGILFIKAYDSLITTRIKRPAAGTLSLLELKPYQSYNPDSTYPELLSDSGTTVSHFRFKRFENKRDRLFSKFVLINKNSKAAIGAPHYVTELGLTTTRSFPLPRPESKKGLSNIKLTSWIDDAVSLGTRHTHYNVVLARVINSAIPDSVMTVEIDGITVPICSLYTRIDKYIGGFTEKGINPFLVLLNLLNEINDPALIHPLTIVEDAIMEFGAFNTSTDEGILLFRAAIEWMAERYTRPDAAYGLISAMVIGNEVTAHGHWHNMGNISKEIFIENYHRSLRIADLACRKYHKDLRVYISLDNHWNIIFQDNASKGIKGKDLIETFNEISKEGGDFPWNIGFHPYPENMMDPSWWQDNQPTLNFNSPILNFKNLEVLPAFLAQSRFHYKNTPRTIDITEVGFTTPEGSNGQQIQAAAYACSWYKVEHIPEIGMYIYHRHYSDVRENLDLGLWTWNDPREPKLIYEVFGKIDTITWTDTTFSWAKPILGIKSWDECSPSSDIVRE
ncbi:MAG: carboxypeptidase regulatory-like domain-containing protein [Fibrobacteria bacterium]|nr:carboxypeptidase regulatory-like domain-containing protein [Fibrobacteria bacterium]